MFSPCLKAKESIVHDSTIIKIPKKIIIDKSVVENSEIECFINDNKFFFDNTKDEKEKNLLILTIFIMREKIKGKKSFYYPFISYNSDQKSLGFWNLGDIENLESTYLRSQVKYMMSNSLEKFILDCFLSRSAE